MNYPDIILAVAAAGALTVSASMVAYHKISGSPVNPQVERVVVNDQDRRLDRIEKTLDEAVARQEIILKKLERVEGTQGDVRGK